MVEPQPRPPTGFAGLAALGVDVSDALGSAGAASPPDATPPNAGTAPRQSAKPYQGPQSGAGGRKIFTRGTLIGIGVVAALVAVGWIGAMLEGGTDETVPPVSTGHTHSRAEIRYCLAEEIRLQAAQAALSRDAKRNDVPAFNRMVDDFNSRCSNYRYRSGTLESARSDIEPIRERLRAEGAARFPR